MEENIIQHIELPSRMDSLLEIETFIDSICDKYSIGEDHYGNILIALTEAINNAITHGNKLDPDKKVKLNMCSKDSGLSFVIQDEGEGFDFNNIPDPTLPENLTKLNGRGVFLMKSLADEVTFEDNGKSITLTFTISAN
ncbi:MAG: ATP-binding protein [Vicingus serpentipes]|nr:ATP-binding protein [Vicingus serpentipes]